jgi:DNA-binding transcriptional LysR family regulator
MPHFLSDFMKVNSGIELDMDVANKTKVINSLKNNEVDFALVSILPDDLALESEVLMDNKLFLVGDKHVDINLKLNSIDKSLILRELGSATRLSMEKYLKDKGIKSGIKMQLTSNEAVKQAVISGLGYSIMPLIGLKNELEKGDLKIIPLSGLPIITSWRLIWLKGKAMSPVAAAYLAFLRTNKENIRNASFSWTESY